MEDLDFEIVPGVSSFCAAAAALDAEYTLPNVSQSVIITRMEGRTPVPNKQKIADYAAHKATMVIFLSSGMLEKLQKEEGEAGRRKLSQYTRVFAIILAAFQACIFMGFMAHTNAITVSNHAMFYISSVITLFSLKCKSEKVNLL